MARPQADDDEDKPLDPAVEKVRKKLVRFVAINLGLLFLALMAVVVAIVYKTGTRGAAPADVASSPAPAGMLAGTVELPAGARLVSQSGSGDRLFLETVLADGGHVIFVYGMAERRMIGRFDLRAAP